MLYSVEMHLSSTSDARSLSRFGCNSISAAVFVADVQLITQQCKQLQTFRIKVFIVVLQPLQRNSYQAVPYALRIREAAICSSATPLHIQHLVFLSLSGSFEMPDDSWLPRRNQGTERQCCSLASTCPWAHQDELI